MECALPRLVIDCKARGAETSEDGGERKQPDVDPQLYLLAKRGDAKRVGKEEPRVDRHAELDENTKRLEGDTGGGRIAHLARDLANL